jgi:DNA-binding NtrC family response regulator
VRIIAATNRNLRAAVNQGTFRSDLYYRLAVLQIHLPSLRERSGDLPVIVTRLLEGLATKDDPEVAKLTQPPFIHGLRRHHWPGNVRELRNFLERCLVLGEPWSHPDVPTETDESNLIDVNQSLRAVRERVERVYLRKLLEAHHHNVADAARAAGLDRKYLYQVLARHRLR